MSEEAKKKAAPTKPGTAIKKPPCDLNDAAKAALDERIRRTS